MMASTSCVDQRIDLSTSGEHNMAFRHHVEIKTITLRVSQVSFISFLCSKNNCFSVLSMYYFYVPNDYFCFIVYVVTNTKEILFSNKVKLLLGSFVFRFRLVHNV